MRKRIFFTAQMQKRTPTEAGVLDFCVVRRLLAESLDVSSGLLSSGLDVLLGAQLVVIRTEYFHGDEAVLEVITDLLEGVSVTLVIQAATRIGRPQTLCIGVVSISVKTSTVKYIISA